VILKRLTDNYTVDFVKFIVGLRGPATGVSAAEQEYLAGFVRGKRCVVEVGVFEGATSRMICREMDPKGKLYLVDPFFPTVRVERLLNLSFSRQVATRAVRPWQSQVEFVRETSDVAAGHLPLQQKADFIFIDAVHEYSYVKQDFEVWTPMLAQGAVMAFHDSHPCAARPEILPHEGAALLMEEIAEGRYGAWDILGHTDSVTAIRMRPTSPV
jgi:predicted O-methyltransferase YrrM